MLSLVNVSVPHRKKTAVENLQAVFSEGCIHGLFAPNASRLKPLLECIGGQRASFQGEITWNGLPPAGMASYTDGLPANLDCSKTILLLHNLHTPAHDSNCTSLTELLRPMADAGKLVIISSSCYTALRHTCDFIYLFDKKRFPVVVGKADFPQFDEFFENVFRR
jgi:ABC-type multidrug transport system ATPase subunit